MIILSIIVLIIIGAFIITYYNMSTYIIKMQKNENWDLKPSYKLTQGLSVITLCQGGKDYNCLIDTGSNFSHMVSTCTAKTITSQYTEMVEGIGGEGIQCAIHTVSLYYNKIKYEIPVRIGAIDEAANIVKQSYGVTIDLILGSDFLAKYNKVLDYKNLIIHTAK